MKIHLITPWSRNIYKEIQINFLKDKNIILHPIELQLQSEWNETWIEPMVMPTHDNNWDPVYEKLNYFIQNYTIIDNDYYAIYSDNNGFEDKFIDDIIKYNNNSDVIFCSDKFNKEITLKIIPGDESTFVVSKCGLYQFIVKGYVLKTMIFENIYYADGLMMNKLYKSSLSRTYLPETYAIYDMFNEKWCWLNNKN
jgi:hypothetical protein